MKKQSFYGLFFAFILAGCAIIESSPVYSSEAIREAELQATPSETSQQEKPAYIITLNPDEITVTDPDNGKVILTETYDSKSPLMKAILKENGEVKVLREGNLAELKTYLTDNLGGLLDWLDETENNWENFAELKNSIKENVENADSVKDLEKAFEEINSEMSWWGIFVEN